MGVLSRYYHLFNQNFTGRRDSVNLSPLPIAIEDELEYEISQILDSKLNHCRKPPLLYYVH